MRMGKSLVCSTSTYRCIQDTAGFNSGYLLPNDYCQSNSECAQNLCENGRCQGRGLNQPCTSNSQCATGFYCPSSGTQVCTAQSAQCTSGQSDQCPDHGTMCINNVCVAVNSVDFGQACTPNDLGSYQPFSGNSNRGPQMQLPCVDGMVCQNSQCMDTRSVSALVHTNCTFDDSVCSNPLLCLCSGTTQGATCEFQTYNYGSVQRKEYLKCLTDNNCHRQSDPRQPQSCARTKCLGQYESLVSESASKSQQAQVTAKARVDSCNLRPSSASTVESSLLTTLF